MKISKCPYCGGTNLTKHGVRNGHQRYCCKDCDRYFRNSRLPSSEKLLTLYVSQRKTVADLAVKYRVSASTIKRRLREISLEWEQPDLSGCSGFVHIDATYWGRNFGVLLAVDNQSGAVLYLDFIKHENAEDYRTAIGSIEARHYKIKGIIVDGNRHLFSLFKGYSIQMCQFHMRQITRRYLTLNPRLLAARALKEILGTLTTSAEADFMERYAKWKEDWKEVIKRRSLLKSGRKVYRHKRLRSAMLSLDFYLPYLFTFQKPECEGMPNTNNKIEGIFTDLKKKLNIHCGMSKMSRKRLILEFFSAWAASHCMKPKKPEPQK